MNYRNERANRENLNPRQELEEFVDGYFGYITSERKRKIIDTHHLRAVDEKEQLIEFVRTKNPYDVLNECFAHARLHLLAEEKYKINPDADLEDHDIIGVILDELGFKKEVKPVGLPQIQNDIEISLKIVESVTELSVIDVMGICGYMAHIMETILPVLFLFHIGALQKELHTGALQKELTERKTEKETEADQEKRDDKGSLHEIANSLTALCKGYKKDKSPTLKNLVNFQYLRQND